MAKMRLLYKWRKKHINNIHQLCQYLAYLAYLATFGRMKKRLLLRFSCCGLLSISYLCGNPKQDHYEKCKNT
jgi:hypothetical protein